MAYTSTGTLAADTLLAGDEAGFTAVQLSPTSAQLSWGNLFDAADGKVRLTIALLAADGTSYPTEQRVVTNTHASVVTDLYADFTWRFSLVAKSGKTFTADLTLNATQETLALDLDGWHSTKPKLNGNLPGTRQQFARRIVRTATGQTNTRVEKEVTSAGGDNSGSRFWRRQSNMRPGWQYICTAEIMRTKVSTTSGYKLRAYGVKSVRGVQTKELLDSSDLIFDNAYAGGQASGSIAVFKNRHSTVEFALEAIDGDSGPAGTTLEAVALTAFTLTEKTLDSSFTSGSDTIPANRRISDMAMDGSLASYLDITCNSVGAAWWVDSDGYLRFDNLLSDPGQPYAYFADTGAPGTISYLADPAPELTRDTTELINELTVTNHGVAVKALSTDEWAADDKSLTFRDKKSIDKYGVRSASVEWALDPKGDIVEMRAREVFRRYAERQGVRVTKITCNVQSAPATLLRLQPFMKVWVELQGLVHEAKVIHIDRDLNPERSTIDITLLPLSSFRSGPTFADFNARNTAKTFAEFAAQQDPAQTFNIFNKQAKKRYGNG